MGEKQKNSQSFKRRVRDFKRRFKLDSHHSMERFGIIFTVLSVIGVMLFTGAGVSAYTTHQAQLNDIALYTPKVKTSLSGQSAKIPGVYVDKSHTRALVMFHFTEGARNMPSDPKEYQMFLTGTDTDLSQNSLVDQKSQFSAEYVVFGNPEWMGVVLNKKNGFDVSLLDLVVRSNKLIADKNKGKGARKGEDNSFNNFDQWRVIFNPGAKNAEIAPLGAAGTPFNPADVYYQVVSKPEETKVREEMEGQLEKLQTDLERIKQADVALATTSVNDRGESIHLVPPTVPAEIRNDKVVGKLNRSKKESTLRLDAPKVIPGGYDFNWRDGTIKDGYLDHVVPKGQTYLDYLRVQQEVSASMPKFNDIEFKLSNGQSLNSYGAEDTLMQPLFTVRNNLLSAYQTYYNDKKQYQRKMYSDLLNLEISLRNVESNSVSHGSDSTLRVY